MTNRLPRITRRHFLTESAIAGAGFLSWSSAIGLSDAARPVDPNRWVLLSDTHLSHRPQDRHRGVVPSEGKGSFTMPDTSEKLLSSVPRLAVSIEDGPARAGAEQR